MLTFLMGRITVLSLMPFGFMFWIVLELGGLFLFDCPVILCSSVSPNCSSLWRLAFFATCWSLLWECNNSVFRNLVEPNHSVTSRIFAKCTSWAFSLEEFRNISMIDILQAWKECIDLFLKKSKNALILQKCLFPFSCFRGLRGRIGVSGSLRLCCCFFLLYLHLWCFSSY